MSKNLQILILVGAPGSGKTTFARYFLRTEANWMRLGRDDFRAMQFVPVGNLPNHEEHLISELTDAAIEALLYKRCNVLIDATHCRKRYIDHYIERFNHLADISFKLFDVDAVTLAERCSKRFQSTGKLIPRGTLKKFIKELELLKQEFDFAPRPKIAFEIPVVRPDANLPKAIICDLDGTLAIMCNRNPYDATHCDQDALNEPVAKVLNSFFDIGYKILLVTGREERFRKPTLRFLEKNNIEYHELWMRKTKDTRKDAIIKREIFDAEIAGKYFIEFVLDDRNQVVEMWRKELKLPCFQVNYGNF